MLAFSTTLLLLCCSTAFLGYATAEECPPEHLTRPCTCESGDPVLICEGITDVSILEGVVQRTWSFRFVGLRLINSIIDSIPSRHLEKFEEVSIEDSQLKSIVDEPDASHNVVSLHLQNASFTNTFSWELVEPLRKMKIFKADRMDIPKLDQSFIDKASRKLVYISLNGTHTSEIIDGAFSPFRSLRKVSIQNNELEEWKRSYFSRPADRIETILLNGNKLKEVPADMFEGMPNLKRIDISSNSISTISEDVLGNTDSQKLIFVNLAGNPLSCDCKLRWILNLISKTDVYGTCESPENVSGKALKGLEERDFENCE